MGNERTNNILFKSLCSKSTQRRLEYITAQDPFMKKQKKGLSHASEMSLKKGMLVQDKYLFRILILIYKYFSNLQLFCTQRKHTKFSSFVDNLKMCYLLE